jgi:aconitase A
VSGIDSLLLSLTLSSTALQNGLKFKSAFTVTPGTERIRATLESDEVLNKFEESGATILANACGPCIGQWHRSNVTGEPNSIISSFNRNFAGRNDGNVKTHSFLASPEIVTAMALSGSLLFNPITDLLEANGKKFRLNPPKGSEFPKDSFKEGRSEFSVEKFSPRADVELNLPPKSDRLQQLPPWPANVDRELLKMPVLIKVQGKCTTDHISPAGKWLKYKGHLENISECTLIGAHNAENGKINNTYSLLDGTWGTVPDVAKAYKKAGVPWVVITDFNYGEGSAREHAALQVRYLGGRVVIARSFARIHETNLKKQGVLPLTFVDPNDYEKVHPRSTISVYGLDKLAPKKNVEIIVHDPSGSEFQIETEHTMSDEQLQWFYAGSSLNLAASSVKSSSEAKSAQL